MSRPCDSYREQALADGMNSHAAAHWRLHSKNCNACRNEICVLDTLCREAGEQRQHISHKDYTRLMETVRQLYQPKKQTCWSKLAWSFSWKAASLAALLVFLFKIATPIDHHGGKNSLLSTPAQMTKNEFFADTFTTGSDQGRLIAAPVAMPNSTLNQEELADLFNSLSGTPLEQDLQRMRSSVGKQIDAFSILLDRELDGGL